MFILRDSGIEYLHSSSIKVKRCRNGCGNLPVKTVHDPFVLLSFPRRDKEAKEKKKETLSVHM